MYTKIFGRQEENNSKNQIMRFSSDSRQKTARVLQKIEELSYKQTQNFIKILLQPTV